MTTRTPILPAVETHVLMASARRCALCFGFDGDLTRKKGQIAHIDQNAANAADTNLVYLCLEHHDEYDGRTSQAKGITQAELRAYKARLLQAIEAGDHLRSQSAVGPTVQAQAIRGHDQRIFAAADQILPEPRLTAFLDQLQSDDSYLLLESSQIDRFRDFFSQTGNQFLDHELSSNVAVLLERLDRLLLFLARNFFVFPNSQGARENPRLCMRPELNVDREGPGTPDSMREYDKYQKELDTLSDEARRSYASYRSSVKVSLQL